MIRGFVSEDGTPYIRMPLADREWLAVVDTGFNGYLELPLVLKTSLQPTYFARGKAQLAGGQNVVEDIYTVDIWFDERRVEAFVTFVDTSEILLGTAMLRDHHLEVDFPSRNCVISRREPTP